MDINLAIERHRRQLARIVATLFAMIGLGEDKSIERLPLPVYRAVLRVLRPAESAVRRLIVVAARGLVLKPLRLRAASKRHGAAGKRGRRITFKLFDPRRRFSSAFAHERGRGPIRLVRVPRPEPRIRVLNVGFDPRVPLFRNSPPPVAPQPLPTPPPAGAVDALRLCRRLAAVKSALEDLPRQARRYARWQAKPAELRRPNLSSALRPGTPPGFRKNSIHKVDEILAECHWLARQPPQHDTS